VLRSNRGDRAFPRELEKTIWSEKNEADLTSLTGRYQKLDAFSKWISQLLRLYHNKIGHRLRDPISLAEASVQLPVTQYSDGKLAATVSAISTILSSLLPTMSIFTLYFIPHPLARMAAIVAFSLLFSVALTVIAKAKRVDCFAATTAFAAVQVVFVGTTVGSTKG
jgi:acyl transferase domain-containing protein